MKDVWFGYHIPPEGRTFEDMKNASQKAEEWGFDLFTTTDHLMNMRQPEGPSNHPLECWTLLGGIAAVTNKIRIGPLVSCYGYRAPTLLGKIATTVDIMSNGRLVMGLGAGWHKQEFEGYYGRFPSVKERVRGYKDTLAIVHSMFRNETTSYKGKQFSVDNVLNSPLPVQKEVPLMVGAFGKKTIEIATKYADIIHCMFGPNEKSIAEQTAKVVVGSKKTGRDPKEIRIGAGYQLWLDPTPEEIAQRAEMLHRRAQVPIEAAKKMAEKAPSTPETHRAAIQDFIAKGIKVFTFTGSLDKLGIFAEKVIKNL
jgi:alkanesulfonate monooxygenase SsuD/methylene tetrahydromethanopterin reductase-like flavin-dependent oxidoreductase (luciferase family)